MDAQNAGFSEIYRDLPLEEVDLVLEIVNLAEKELEQSFQSSLYITLADHLHFAIERQKAGLTLTNPLAWEIRKFYKNEYKIGLRALEIVKQKLAIELAQEEASSIALHIVNAQKQGQLIEQTMRIITVVQDILNIVRLHFGITFDEDSISYNRFFTHLQYFAQRVNDGTQQGSNDSFYMNKSIRTIRKPLRVQKKSSNILNQPMIFRLVGIKRCTSPSTFKDSLVN